MENIIINTEKENNIMESIYMQTYAAMFGEEFAKELITLCKKRGTDLATFHWKVIDTHGRECLEEDIISYVEEQGYLDHAPEDGFVDAIANAYNDTYDADMGTWDNIRSAINAVSVDEGVAEKYRQMADKVLGREEE